MERNFKTTTFNDQLYDVYVTFFGDTKNVASMIYKSLCKIVIHENIFDPFYSVEIEYNDDLNAFEKDIELKKSATFLNNISTHIGYRYRGDGHDLVTLEIKIHDNIINDELRGAIDFKCLLCVVDAYRTYDPNTNKYTKTLILEDYAKQILSERQSFYTTKEKISYAAQRTNAQRSILTGQAIYELLADQLGETKLNKQTWDAGSEFIFYSAGINEKAIDTLNNLLKLHNSQADNIHDICFLSHSTGDELWSLVSLANIYDNAVIKPNKVGALNVGKVFLDTSNESNVQQISRYTPYNALLDRKTSAVSYYDFKDLQRDDAINLNSHIVYNYNTNNKEFVIDCKNGYIDNFRDFLYLNYTKKMIGKNDSAYPNLPLTKTKTANITTNNVFNLYDNVNDNFGRNKLLSIATILNNGIEITTLGSTMRRPGLFLSVDSSTSGIPNDYNGKIYGDYLIVSSNHIFNNTTYNTNCICIKPYVYNKPESEPKELING